MPLVLGCTMSTAGEATAGLDLVRMSMQSEEQ